MAVSLVSQIGGLINSTLSTKNGKTFLVTEVTTASVLVAVGPNTRIETISLANLQKAVNHAHVHGKVALPGPAAYRTKIADNRPAYTWAILHHLGYV